jgi:rRNA biogenesis protein RRP36
VKRGAERVKGGVKRGRTIESCYATCNKPALCFREDQPINKAHRRLRLKTQFFFLQVQNHNRRRPDECRSANSQIHQALFKVAPGLARKLAMAKTYTGTLLLPRAWTLTEARYMGSSPHGLQARGSLIYLQGSHSDNSDKNQDLDIGSVSFGALAKAQSTVNRRREIPHRRLGEIKGPGYWHDSRGRTEEGLIRKDRKDILGRASKHAPTELSSKKAVSRKRDAVMVPKRESRDPRFDPLAGPLDDRMVRKNYAFLEGYRESEMKSIGNEIKRTKDESVKEMLKKELLSMVNFGILVFAANANFDIGYSNPGRRPKRRRINSKKS